LGDSMSDPGSSADVADAPRGFAHAANTAIARSPPGPISTNGCGPPELSRPFVRFGVH